MDNGKIQHPKKGICKNCGCPITYSEMDAAWLHTLKLWESYGYLCFPYGETMAEPTTNDELWRKLSEHLHQS